METEIEGSPMSKFDTSDDPHIYEKVTQTLK